MRLAQRLFLFAGILGLVVLPALYFTEGFFAHLVPPEFSHPEFYYGFVGVTLAFQVVYLIIGLDPLRYRPLMPVAAAAKGSFVATMVVMVALGRIPLAPALSVLPDFVFAVLFLYAFFVTAPAARATSES